MIERIFETHLNVRDLERSMDFYGNVLGLELASSDLQRRIAFYWVGGRNVAMLGLWEKPAEVVVQHFAFQVSIADFQSELDRVKSHGIPVYNFLDDGTDRPMVFGWMPALSIYFRDPDEHELEFIAPLPGPPRPEVDLVSLDQWKSISPPSD
jgi:catechol 2,3-dioxygenase-like lactoylglutathione lyase family enzyme